MFNKVFQNHYFYDSPEKCCDLTVATANPFLRSDKLFQ